jgi:hypothetical protein
VHSRRRDRFVGPSDATRIGRTGGRIWAALIWKATVAEVGGPWDIDRPPEANGVPAPTVPR